ncbi:MAG: YCF48-related protein [Candidatus Aquicultorales bacterium]
MKKRWVALVIFFLLAVIVPSGAALAAGTWTHQNGTNWYNGDISGVKFVDPNNGWVTGTYGYIARTTNGGTTWTNQSSGTMNFLHKITFVDLNNGWVVGEQGTILHTTNGGMTWSSQVSGTSNYLAGVYFFNANDGWVVGQNGTVLKTDNGGVTWTSVSIGTTDYLDDITFLNQNTGWIVGQSGHIRMTTNGGSTWTLQPTPVSTYVYSVDAVDATHVWASGQNGVILKYDGTSWTQQTSGATDQLFAIDFVDSSNGWAVGWGNVIRHTTNGGATWGTQASSGTVYYLHDICMLDVNTGWAVGPPNAIEKYTDTLPPPPPPSTQLAWVSQNSGSVELLQGIFFVDASNGWAVGNYGTLLHTTDGGANWNPQVSGVPAGYSLHKAFFLDTLNGWFTADMGVIRHTTNGGVTWTTQPTNTPWASLGIHFIDGTHGWTAGAMGTILAYDGTSWSHQTSGTTAQLEDVFFIDANHGWAVGAGGTILGTSNGGTNWDPQTSGTTQTLKAVYFADTSHGWAAGDYGVLLYTADGGNNWNPQASGTTNHLFDIAFADTNNGWIVGFGSTILHTSNGGSSWNLQASGAAGNFFSVAFSDATNGWTSGSAGTLLRYGPNTITAGSDVAIGIDQVSVLFDSVVTGGNVTVTQTGPATNPPSGFSFLGNAFDITATAVYDTTGGNYIYITIPYTYTGNPNDLKLYHEEGGVWVDRTYYVDYNNNTITARVTSLSPFAVGAPSGGGGGSSAVPTSSLWALLGTAALGLGLLGAASRKRGARILMLCLTTVLFVGLFAQAGSAYTENYRFITKWGSFGAAEGEFMGPLDVAVDSHNNVYVVDQGNSRIQKFDSNGAFVRTWGSVGNASGQFNGPKSIAIDSADNVYVVESGTFRVQVFDTDGNFLRKWGHYGVANGDFFYPVGIATSSESGTDYVYVLDKGNNGVNEAPSLTRVQKFDTNGNFVTKWGHFGFTNGRFWDPSCIDVDSNGGYVFVGDSGNFRVQKFMTNGNYNFQWGGPAYTPSLGPTPGIAVDKWGDVFISDNRTIQKYDGNGTYITKWGGTNPPFDSYGTGDGQFKYPQGVAVDSSGNVYVADINNHRIQKFNNNRILTGTDVIIGIAHIELAFDSVTTEGEVTITAGNTELPPPPGYKRHGGVYDIHTTAGYDTSDDRYIDVSLPYPYSNDPGRLRLFHREGSTWVDRTVSVDQTNKRVVGRVKSFSDFMIGEPLDIGASVPASSMWSAIASAGVVLLILFGAMRRKPGVTAVS